MKLFILNISILCILLIALNSYASEKPTVFVSIVPQKYFVQQISGDLVKVEVMVQPGASPATYEPKPSQMAGLSSCALYFAVGVPFENVWLDRISAMQPKMKIVRTDRNISKIAMARHHHEEGEGEQIGEAKQHGHPILDPHIWLAPSLVKQQAAEILAGLIDLLPGEASALSRNYHLFLKQVDALDLELKALLQDRAGMRFMVFHPSWGYFAREYALLQVPIEIEGKAPKPAQLAEIIYQARNNDIQIVFVQPQFSQKSAAVIAKEIGGKVEVVDPLAGDWQNNLRDVARKFNRAVK